MPRRRWGRRRLLWREGVDFRLVLIGAVEPDALAEQALLRRLAGEERLVCLGAAPDAVVREAYLGRARALLFPSEGEGFGLPPVEALFCGIPVIVAAGLPALEGVPPLGQIRLSPPDRDNVAAALRTLFDDGAASACGRTRRGCGSGRGGRSRRVWQAGSGLRAACDQVESPGRMLLDETKS